MNRCKRPGWYRARRCTVREQGNLFADAIEAVARRFGIGGAHHDATAAPAATRSSISLIWIAAEDLLGIFEDKVVVWKLALRLFLYARFRRLPEIGGAIDDKREHFFVCCK